MQLEIQAVSALPATGTSMLPLSGASPAGGFYQLMAGALTEANSQVATAETAMSNLAAGKPVELHEVMISLERAQLSVQTFVQIRNKLVESYQDLMRMQL